MRAMHTGAFETTEGEVSGMGPDNSAEQTPVSKMYLDALIRREQELLHIERLRKQQKRDAKKAKAKRRRLVRRGRRPAQGVPGLRTDAQGAMGEAAMAEGAE